jgi:tyrosyl-tRNA synthetase
VYFIIGDFTAMIGDPTGRNKTRPPLTGEEIMTNAKTYAEQVFRILDRDRTEIIYNSHWLGQLPAHDMVGMMAKVTVSQLLERDDFTKRYAAEQPIFIHELLYPILQGYDSVVLESDLELGGTDQTFNLLMGRTLQRASGQVSQCVLTMPILEGLDGVQKMSKSLDNYVALTDDPITMFGKLMSIPDAMMERYFTLLTLLSEDAIAQHLAGHPMLAKKALAQMITSQFHGDDAAIHARTQFERVFSKGDAPDEMPEVEWSSGECNVVALIAENGLAPSKGEARRLLRASAVKLDGEAVASEKVMLTPGERVLKVGKRRFLKIIIR